MKTIRIIFSTLAIVISLFSVVLFISCNKGSVKYNSSTLVHPCDNVICLNGGTCTDGLCYCPQGFEGAQCATRWSDRFIGNYLADDACDTTNGYYNTVISADPGYAYKMRLFNVGLFCPGTIMEATINPEKTSFMIPFQKGCGNLYLSGYGNMNGTTINVFLNARDTMNHTTNSCSIIMSKQ